MLVPAVALSCALLLAQAGGEEESLRARLKEALPGLAPPVIQPPASPLPVQEWGERTVCMTLPPTKAVPSGKWRAQCDDATRRCLISPQHELDADGQESERELERVTSCTYESYMDRDDVAKLKTYRLEPAQAEAPPGWYRDERGRVMQFNFDLNRRVWLGGAWSPLMRDGEVQGRVRADFGISTEVQGRDRLHRFRFLETELHLGEPSLEAAVLRYDSSVERDEPLFRITTFFGKPRRYDIDVNLGMWMEVLAVEELERGTREAGFLTLGALHATLDLWHSKDMVSYVRVRAGPALERDYKQGFYTLVPGAALEADLTLDRDGFHHLRFGVEAEKVLLARAVEGRPQRPERLRARAGYELILLAINDQPVSLVVDGRGTWRDDIPGLAPGWEWSAAAGLRFSLWAPARRSAPLGQAAGQ
jgi:hypothetical protein